MCVCVCVCVYVEKVKRKKMFDGLFICQRVSTSIFFWIQKCFIEIILYEK